MLKLEHIDKTYGDRTVLKDMSLIVRPGELFGFVGGNGAGKTTSMRIMLGVVEPDSGTVSFRGRPMDDRSRSRVGYMPEERGLYAKMPIGRQLAFFAELHGVPRRAATEASSYWLRRLGLADRAASALEDLSLGNQQRVQLAAALVHRPQVLILDEPFSGLDPIAVDVMSGILREQADRGVPVLFSSHQLELVERLCDRIGILRDGALVAQGTVDELSANVGVQVLVRGSAPVEAWLPALTASGNPGATFHRLSDVQGATRIKVDREGDMSRVLDAALQRGEVTEFRRWRPSLTELYRDAIDPRPAMVPGDSVAA